MPVWLYICLSRYLDVLNLLVLSSACLSDCLHTCMFKYTYIYIYLSLCLSVCLYIYMSAFPFICMSTCIYVSFRIACPSLSVYVPGNSRRQPPTHPSPHLYWPLFFLWVQHWCTSRITSQIRLKRKKIQRTQVNHHGTIALPNSIPMKMLGTVERKLHQIRMCVQLDAF